MDAAGRLASWALLLLPGGLTIYLSFNGGGFFPNTQAFAALVLAAALGLRIAFAEEPFAGFSKPLGVAVGGLALYALWTLMSAAWSDSTARALLEFNRALLYLLALVLFGSLPRTASNFRWMVRGLALGIVVVCVCGLVTRVLPDVWPISGTLADNRLSYPLTYWNAMGLLASVGAILCFHLACSRSEPALARVLGRRSRAAARDDAVLHVLARRDRRRHRRFRRLRRDRAAAGPGERTARHRARGCDRGDRGLRRRSARDGEPRPAGGRRPGA